jgi:cytoskeletal protein RodZ
VPSLGIGETLRSERERQGISLDDIARNTRIPKRFLDAIEVEDFEGLPGLVFTRNFVRQYSEALHLDAEAIVGGLPKLDESMIQLPDPPLRTRRRKRYRAPNSGFASLVWLTLAIAAVVLLYRHFDSGPIIPMTKIRADIAALRVGIAASGATDVEAASTPATNRAVPEPQAVDPATPLDPPKNSDGTAVSSVQVVVTAVQQAWVELSADGKTAFAGIMMPNETKEISAVDHVKLVAGNAGGVTVSLNGKPLDPLGPVGQVRVVTLTAEGP